MSFPARATLALPLTGAARSAHPRAPAWARIRPETSIETVEVSATIFGTRPLSASRPLGPVITAAKSGESATETMTMSRSASSTGRSTMRAPSTDRGSALDRVRL